MKFRLLSYNIHRGKGTDGVTDIARVGEVIRHYRPDAAALQEILCNAAWTAAGSQGRILAKTAELAHGSVALNCIRREGVYGQLTLARFPIETSENVDLSQPFQITRGALYTRIATPAGPFHLLNVHLGFAGIEQRVQMRLSFDLLDEFAPLDEPAAVCGDMNDWRHQIVPRVVQKRGWRCAIGCAVDAGPPTFPSVDPMGALDKVFVRGPVRVVKTTVSRLALARVASDHLPVLAELEIVR